MALNQRQVAIQQVALMAATTIVGRTPDQLSALIAAGFDLSGQVGLALANPLYAPMLQSCKSLTEQDATAAVEALRRLIPLEYRAVLDRYPEWAERQFTEALKVIKQA